MISAELLNTLQSLNRVNKLYVIQVSELAQQESDLIKQEQSYHVWSPYDAFEAATTMLDALQATKT
ncbi:MAG: hypothetical protein H0U45_00890 [Tatlockia sp.]|nr:hypothetical protein [Tatlockia sp.]